MTAPTIADLEQAEREAADLLSAAGKILAFAMARANEAEAALAEARGDVDRVRWLRATDPAEKHAAYIRVQARHVLASPSAIGALAEQDRAEVSAEVERMRAEGRA